MKNCIECPWVVRNKNNDTIINHSKKWGKKHNCHMKIKGTNKKLWCNDTEFQCVGNKNYFVSSKTLFNLE
jgi:hypothetical protein